MARPQARLAPESAHGWPKLTLSGYRWFIAGIGVACLTAVLSLRLQDFGDPALIAWLLGLALVDLFPVPTWGGATFTSNEPLWVAAMITFPPHIAFAIGTVAFLDPREFRREISLQRGLFNRAQTGLAAGVGSLLFHSLAGVTDAWLLLVPSAVLTAAVYNALNVTFVAGAMSLQERTPLRRAARGLLMDSPRDWLLGYLCFGLLGVVIARLYAETGSVWVVGLSALPLMVLGRGALLHVRLAQQEVRNAQEREARLRVSSQRAAAERKDERMHLAAALHDEAIPTFQALNLLATTASVSFHDSDQMREILQAMRVASDRGSEQLRGIVGELRGSDLGDADLAMAFARLIRDEASRHPGLVLDAHVEEASLPERVTPLVYQIGREALVNAVNHAGATKVELLLGLTQPGGYELRIEDDGHGFDPDDVPEGHFGLALMRERASELGGDLEVATSSRGTVVVVRWPGANWSEAGESPD
jgi:signal transduction histidine kinase